VSEREGGISCACFTCQKKKGYEMLERDRLQDIRGRTFSILLINSGHSGQRHPPLWSEYGTYETVKARTRPWPSVIVVASRLSSGVACRKGHCKRELLQSRASSKLASEEGTFSFLKMTFGLKSRPESGLDCLKCAIFARKRNKLLCTREGVPHSGMEPASPPTRAALGT